ncbi:transcription factor S [Candidatus Woesearchaeota archaeon]|nr:transcription factor S [Candidatus Woesearchaeota archaeon]
MFCPKCGSMLKPKDKGGKRILQCTCGFSKALGDEAHTVVTEKIAKGRKIEVIENIETHPKIKATCGKCGHKIAYYWTQQTRGADEPETRFFKCTECSYTWREYS